MEAYRYILAIGLAVVLAHVIKSLVLLAQTGKLSFNLDDGGFPSGHAALTASLAVMTLISEGIGSPVFGLAVGFYLITVNDAIKTRRSVGEQGEVLRKISKERFKVTRGHTLREVIAGSILGSLVAIVVFLLCR